MANIIFTSSDSYTIKKGAFLFPVGPNFFIDCSLMFLFLFICDMITPMEEYLLYMLVGCAGAVANFLYLLLRGVFKHGKLLRKLFLNMFGGALVAPIFATFFADTFRLPVAIEGVR